MKFWINCLLPYFYWSKIQFIPIDEITKLKWKRSFFCCAENYMLMSATPAGAIHVQCLQFDHTQMSNLPKTCTMMLFTKNKIQLYHWKGLLEIVEQWDWISNRAIHEMVLCCSSWKQDNYGKKAQFLKYLLTFLTVCSFYGIACSIEPIKDLHPFAWCFIQFLYSKFQFKDFVTAK